MRQGTARFQMLFVLWSILFVGLGVGFPTRRKNIAHKVSFLHAFSIFSFIFTFDCKSCTLKPASVTLVSQLIFNFEANSIKENIKVFFYIIK